MRAPGHYGLNALRSMIRIARAGYDGFNECNATYGSFARTRIGKNVGYVLSDPDLIRDVLVDRRTLFKKSPSYGELQKLIGKGMLTAEGDDWSDHRKAAQPAFRKPEVERLVPSLNEAARAALPVRFLDEAIDEEHDIHETFGVFALGVALRTFFDERRAHLIPDVARVIYEGDEIVGSRIRKLNIFPSWMPTIDNDRFESVKKNLEAAFNQLEAFAEDKGDAATITHILRRLKSKDTQSTGMIGNLFSASFETTTNSLTWAVDDLASMPEIQQTLREEIDKVCGSRFMDVSLSELKKLETLDCFIKESMRLKPSIYALGRAPIKPEKLANGFQIKPNNIIVINIAGLHRNPEYWDEPNEFRLSRFEGLDTVEMARSCTYLPFSVGARNCIGSKLAVLEIKVMLVHLLSRYEISKGTDYDTTIVNGFTLRPKSGLNIHLKTRTSAAKKKRRFLQIA